jgi:transcriptional regulator with XRE-family HTH domain
MISGALLREARRRAGLSQVELGLRVERAQTQIARWERGAVEPSLETLRRLVQACDLELTVGLATRDDSYTADAAEHLALTPARRLARAISAANAVRSFARKGLPFDPLPVLRALDAAGVRFVLIGTLAGALRGSPLLPIEATVTLVPQADPVNLERLATALATSGATGSSSEARRWLSNRGEIAIDPAPRGTAGYSDLRRDATLVEAADGVQVRVASLLDLVRIAEAATEPEQHAAVIALRATLELAETNETTVSADA